jgi:PilZ domain-containing protein
MTESRHRERTISSETCELELSGSRYQCRLDNVSSAGAMVKCIGFLQEAWPGDKGVLRQQDHSQDLTCHITRIGSSEIGLRFDN